MNATTVFTFSSNLAVLGWLYLIFAARWTTKLFSVVRVALPLALALIYAASLGVAAPDWQGGFSSLESVRLLFKNDWALAAGWVHYLAFDFLVGAWILDKARAERLNHFVVAPCLVATFLVGPAGYLLFQALRRALAVGQPRLAR